MVVELQNIELEPGMKVWIPEVGSFDSLPFEHCVGSVYKLNQNMIQALCEGCGFTARFHAYQVTSAYLDIAAGAAAFLLEISKNSRPADVAVRYTRDIWTKEIPSHNSDTRRRTLKSTYTANLLPTKIITALCDYLHIAHIDFEKYVIRINFKTETATLIVDAINEETLPVGEIYAFSVLNNSVVPHLIENGVENMSMVTSQFRPDVDHDSWKYATYSQSEVDRLLRKQAESLTGVFAAKIANQQKLVNELVVSQRKEARIAVSEVSTQIQQFHMDAKKHSELYTDQVRTITEKAQNEIDVQIEQAKADLDHTLMSELKNVGKKIQALEANLESLAEKSHSNNSQAIFILVALSIVMSIANMILLLVHH